MLGHGMHHTSVYTIYTTQVHESPGCEQNVVCSVRDHRVLVPVLVYTVHIYSWLSRYGWCRGGIRHPRGKLHGLVFVARAGILETVGLRSHTDQNSFIIL